MVYNILVKNGLESVMIANTRNKKAAQKMANNWAKNYSDCLVFIEVFRKSDNQIMYLNKNGFDVIGKAW